MDVVVFSQRLRRLLAGDEGPLHDGAKEQIRRIQTDIEIMNSFVRKHEQHLSNFRYHNYLHDPSSSRIWDITMQLVDFAHVSEVAIDIFVFNIMQQKRRSDSMELYDAHALHGLQRSINMIKLKTEMNVGRRQEILLGDMMTASSDRVKRWEREALIELKRSKSIRIKLRRRLKIRKISRINRRTRVQERQRVTSILSQVNDSSSPSEGVKKKEREFLHELERSNISRIQLLEPMSMDQGIISMRPQVNDSSSSERVKRRGRELISNKTRMVGREKEMEKLLDLLIEGQPSLSAISIIKLSGYGKTTLAAEVYNSNYVKNYFDCRVWVMVSYNYNTNKILDDILKSVMPSSELSDVLAKDCRLKKTTLRDYLRNKRYLIVLDDVWKSDSRNDLSEALPDDHNGSRVLITSHLPEVNDNWNGHKLTFPRLGFTESLEMLADRTSNKESNLLELELIVTSLTVLCRGWPLAILCFAGLLSESDNHDVLSKLDCHYNQVKETWLPKPYWLLSYSYINLPFYLRPCFLYFAVFPEGIEIFTRQLYQLWIGEGLIQDNSEATADEYLEELINAGFVQVNKRTSGGRIKTCHINGHIHNMLFETVDLEKFINVHLGYGGKPSSETLKRLSIHFDASMFVPSEYTAPYLNSLLCLGSKSDNLAQIDCNYIFENFKLLRVLDLGTLVLNEYPIGIETLFLLRYLKLNVHSFTEIPPSLCNSLLNLYTLDMPYSYIDHTPDDIWKMHKLRHLNVGLINLPAHPGKYCSSLEKLNFISTLHPSSCTQDILGRLPNLQSLRIKGNLGFYQSVLSKSLCELFCLESLKLVNENKMPKLSSIILGEYQFPPRLTQLSLSNTEMKDDPMPTLEKLPHLKVLKLKDNSYSGRRLACSSGGFPMLEVLHLKSMLWLEEWTMETEAMQKLESLIINPCAYLRKLPEELWRMKSFCKLELWWPRPELKQRLKEFEDVERYDIEIYPSGL